jgi:hypothetical protein
VLAIAVLLAASVAIVAHGYLGTFGRYIADDFCTASTLRRLGFVQSQVNWYTTWTGRYAYTFVVTLTQVVGPALTPWLPALALAGWGAAVVFAVQRLQGRSTPLLASTSIGAIHVFSTLRGAPNVYQSLYWQTGMVTYTLPLILGVVYASWLWRTVTEGTPRRAQAAGGSLAAAFVLGGFSETHVALQTTMLLLFLLSLPQWVHERKRDGALIVGGGLLGSILGALTIALAPGTQVRRGLMPAPPELGPWIEATLRDGYLFLARTVKGSPEAVILAILVPLLLVVLLTWRSPDVPVRPRGSYAALVALPLATPVVMLSTIAPYEFAISSYPDGRVLITTMFVLVSALVLWGGNLGNLLCRASWSRSAAFAAAPVALSVLVVIGLTATSLRSTAANLATSDAARAYAESWDTRDENLRRVPADSELVPAASLRHMGGLAEIGHDPQEWINLCVAGTYGLHSVVAK